MGIEQLPLSRILYSGWWFGKFMFHNTWDNPSHLTFTFFRGVGQPPTSIVPYVSPIPNGVQVSAQDKTRIGEIQLTKLRSSPRSGSAAG